jgi:lipid II:glycine glycyltransferase (peptidoglycan interpeptide bridge formation enzyme)
MKLRFATEEEIENWNTIISQNPLGGNILQGKEFAEQKELAGWIVHYIISDTCGFTVLEKKIPLMGKVWYSPKGPAVASAKELEDLLKELKPFARSHGVFSIKIEPELDHTVDLTRLNLIKTKPIQYNYATVLIDLSPSIDEILAGLNQKGRHAIRRAERDGVTVKAVEPTEENYAIMYSLFKETASGAGFTIRPPEYYREFYNRYSAHGNGQLFFAYFEGKVVAGAFAMVQGTKSMYKDGASVRERTAYGASHLLQWEVIKWAKEKGSKEHDLAGVPPITEIKNADHPFYGLGRFKTSFNKTVTEYVGAYDVPIQPLKAKLWHKYIEKIVRRLHFKKYHESYY